jgi:hypothetical protein
MRKNQQTMLPLGLSAILCILTASVLADSTTPIAKTDLVFAEMEGILAVEAEHFHKQTLSEKRAWHVCTAENAPTIKPDPDPIHVAGASGGAYLEILPDTRANHGEKLIQGENFTDKPGLLAVLSYKVHFNTPGRYYVWIRSLSTGSEDNGVHVGRTMACLWSALADGSQAKMGLGVQATYCGSSYRRAHAVVPRHREGR